MDSVRDNLTKEDITTTIEMELNADISNNICILLVEGSTDKKFARRVFRENVVCYESFSGKNGLMELMEEPIIQDNRVIAVRDRDYCNINELPERMFTYDTSCLELMLLKSEEVAAGIHCTYYIGMFSPEELLTNAMRKLAPYSILREKNEKNNMKIQFQRVGFGDLVKSEDQFEIDQLFQRLHVSDSLAEDCKREASFVETDQLYDITNGHDICIFLGEILKNAGKKLGETGCRNALLNGFRKNDFQRTQLYGKIKAYQSEHELKFVD